MAENGLRPIHDTTPLDIFVCSYPRSGVTWFQNLLAGVVHGIDPQFAHDSLIQDLVPDVHYKQFYKCYGPTAYFKSHALPQKQYRRVVYLLRDGRDAMVSYYHFLTALQGRLDFLRLVQGHGLAPCHWHEHVEQWTANPHGADMIVIKYEDLQTATVRELRRFCSFAGLQRDDAHLEHVAQKAAFRNARAKEQLQGWDNTNWPREHAFIRRGEVGSYRDEMPPEVLTAFLAEAGATLARFGYLAT
jgi:hypothetical protein